MSARSGLREATRGDRGLSLAELMVTVAVLSIVTLIVVSVTTVVTRAFTRDRSAADSTNIAAIGMNELTRVIRSGTEIRVSGTTVNKPVFLAAAPESVVLHAYLDTDAADPKPVAVRFSITSDRRLVEERWPANAASDPYWTFSGLPTAPHTPAPSHWTGADSTRIVARLITPQGAGDPPTFRYYDKDGVELVPPVSGAFTVDQLRTIASVTVRLSVQADLTARAQPVVIQNSVGIPNLGITRIGL